MQYWLGGKGPPLLLLHGFGGDATWTWHPQVRALARRHTLVIPDLVWFGQSHSSRADRSLFFQAEVQGALMQHLGIDRFDLCGISYGGLVAFSLAAAYPTTVRRLVIVDSPGPAYTELDHQQMLARFGVADVADVVIPRGPDGVRRLLELAWHRPPPTPRFLLRETYAEVFCDHVDEKRGLLAWLDHQRQNPALRPDASVPHRTLLVWGEHDPLFPLNVAERFRDALPDARLVVVPDTRHAPNLERPRRFNQVVGDFLRQ